MTGTALTNATDAALLEELVLRYPPEWLAIALNTYGIYQKAVQGLTIGYCLELVRELETQEDRRSWRACLIREEGAWTRDRSRPGLHLSPAYEAGDHTHGDADLSDL